MEILVNLCVNVCNKILFLYVDLLSIYKQGFTLYLFQLHSAKDISNISGQGIHVITLVAI